MFNSTASRSKGFTLIELVIVITILGILAAVAIPKFLNLSTDAQTAATKGVAGALASAAASNYAARSENTSLSGTSPVASCGDVGALLAGNSLPTGYSISPSATALASGTTANCTVIGPNSSSAAFPATGVS